MARLVSYKKKDENRYTHFDNDDSQENFSSSSNANNLRFNLLKKPKTIKKHSKAVYIFCQYFCCIKLMRACCCCSSSSSSSWCGTCHHRLFCTCCGSCGDCLRDCIDVYWCGNGIEGVVVDRHEDDIDGKFARAKYEMHLREINNVMPSSSSIASTSMRNNSQYKTHNESSTGNNNNNSNNNIGNSTACNVDNLTKYYYRNAWSWDDSLRSNSDRFLETLEFDTVDGTRSWKRNFRKIPKIKITAFHKGTFLVTQTKNNQQKILTHKSTFR